MLSRSSGLIALILVASCNSTDRHLPIAAHASGALSIDSLRCGQTDDRGRCTLYEVSMYELIARPEDFSGKRVRVVGFAHFEFEGNGLYAHREDWERDLTRNGVWLDPPRGRMDSLNDRYLLVEGRFDATMRGHMGMWSGSLDSVSRYDAWGSTPRDAATTFRPAKRR